METYPTGARFLKGYRKGIVAESVGSESRAIFYQSLVFHICTKGIILPPVPILLINTYSLFLTMAIIEEVFVFNKQPLFDSH